MLATMLCRIYGLPNSSLFKEEWAPIAHHIITIGEYFLSHAPICKKQFNVIEEHYVIVYAKFVIDGQVGSRIINVIQNILFINK